MALYTTSERATVVPFSPGGVAMARTMDRVEVDQTALDDLTTGFRGEVVRPTDPGYEDHRKVWNGSIDRNPAVITRCAGVADVISAVRFGQRTGLPVAVRG